MIHIVSAIKWISIVIGAIGLAASAGLQYRKVNEANGITPLAQKQTALAEKPPPSQQPSATLQMPPIPNSIESKQTHSNGTNVDGGPVQTKHRY